MPIAGAIFQAAWAKRRAAHPPAGPSPETRPLIADIAIDPRSGTPGAGGFIEHFRLSQGEMADTRYKLVPRETLYAMRPDAEDGDLAGADDGASAAGDFFGNMTGERPRSDFLDPFGERRDPRPNRRADTYGYGGTIPTSPGPVRRAARPSARTRPRAAPAAATPIISSATTRDSDRPPLREFDDASAASCRPRPRLQPRRPGHRRPGADDARRQHGAYGKVRDFASVTAVDPASLKPGEILFTDHRDNPTVPENGLIPYLDWLKARPAEAQALSPFPGYKEPDYTVTLNGVTKPRHETLKVYVAEGRFVVPRPAEAIDLKSFANLGFVQAMDPAIKHKTIDPNDVTPTKDPRPPSPGGPTGPGARPPRPASSPERSRRQAPPRGAPRQQAGGGLGQEDRRVRLVPKRAAGARPVRGRALTALTKIETPPAGGLEQTIFWVNQILRFGKFLAVLQPMPNDPQKTVVTTYVALAIKGDVLDRKAEYARVPVLKNLLPAQVLMGNSTFNTGNSISAGLPVYARNRIAAFAEAVAKR